MDGVQQEGASLIAWGVITAIFFVMEVLSGLV